MTAIVMQAEPGAELNCRARNHVFGKTERGVLSYYAANTFAHATTVESWLGMIKETADKDFAQNIITDFHRPDLQILGDPLMKLPGEPAAPKIR